MLLESPRYLAQNLLTWALDSFENFKFPALHISLQILPLSALSIKLFVSLIFLTVCQSQAE